MIRRPVLHIVLSRVAPRLLLLPITALLLCVMHVAAAVGDEAKIGGLWVPNIVIDSIVDGKLIYTVQGREIERPLTEVSGLKMQAYPELGQAVDLLEADKPAEALPLLRQVQTAARDPWLKAWVRQEMVRAHDAAGKPVDAVTAFIELALDAATEPAYFADPPLQSLVQANEAQRKQLTARVTDAMGRTKNEAGKASLQKIVDALAVLDQAPADGAPLDPSTMPELGGAPSKSVIAMPRRLIEDEKDPIAALLRQGQFEQALDQATAQLAEPTGTMARLLYLQGLSQLYIADRNGDAAGYKDAGLSFMRVVSYFRNSTQWTIPAYLELAYIHQRIGRPELAQRLLDDGVGVMIDPETDPELYERYRKIAGLEEDEPSAAADEQ